MLLAGRRVSNCSPNKCYLTVTQGVYLYDIVRSRVS
jgi:hypothetical protein